MSPLAKLKSEGHAPVNDNRLFITAAERKMDLYEQQSNVLVHVLMWVAGGACFAATLMCLYVLLVAS